MTSKRVVVTRTESLPDGTFGILQVLDGSDLVLVLATVEDDWKDNRPGESSIPEGVYRLQRSWYYRGGYECFEITNVPGRSRILIHIANTEEDVKGCIGVGTRRGRLRVVRDEDTGEENVMKEAVVNSRIAFGRLMDALADADSYPIQIVEA